MGQVDVAYSNNVVWIKDAALELQYGEQLYSISRNGNRILQSKKLRFGFFGFFQVFHMLWSSLMYFHADLVNFNSSITSSCSEIININIIKLYYF